MTIKCKKPVDSLNSWYVILKNTSLFSRSLMKYTNIQKYVYTFENKTTMIITGGYWFKCGD